MFVFDEDYTFEWPVTVKYPGIGVEVEASFTGIFKLPEDELDLYAQTYATTTEGVIKDIRSRLSEYWVGWRDIETKDGGELAYSEEAKERLLRQRHMRLAIDIALTEGVTGIREKN